jgi:cyclic beta-1,2-glucan synthetase
LRTSADIIASNKLDVSHLWRFAISGDRPILLIRCRSADDLTFLTQCLRAQEYLRIKRLYVDVVILNEERHSYIDALQNDIERLVHALDAMSPLVAGEERGRAFALRSEMMSRDERNLLLATARVVLQPDQGSLAEQLQWPDTSAVVRVSAEPKFFDNRRSIPGAHSLDAGANREFFNGMGGFTADGREYLITLAAGRNTPAPWVNVIANEQFGSIVSERGAMCTWSLNSRENQLTPWSNDAVSDATGEAVYIWDAETQDLWSPAPAPIRLPDAQYDIAHGQGYSRFMLTHAEIASELLVMVPPVDPIKICRLQLRNMSSRSRRLTIVSYVEWVLGFSASVGTANIVTHLDPVTKAMFAQNAAHPEFGSRLAFCDLSGRQQHWTASRREFLGRGGHLASPAGLHKVEAWSARTGAGFDPCCAFALTIDLAPGMSDEIVMLLGQAEDVGRARELIAKYRATAPVALMREITAHWDGLLGAVQIHTPDRALDLLFNRWLLYQTISCRLWGRAGFYQAGGAYGFRDQLQDAMALAVSHPAITRGHLLRAAARQFVEGDVQHWWHPQSGSGVRTHFSDDRLWLPFAVSQYLAVSGDSAVLEESLPFLEGAPLAIDQEDAHFAPTIAAQSAPLYEHCARAIDVSLRVGAHGLPLMGGGDWNDGMNRVGHAGRGESVWLAWFLIVNLRQFATIARQRGEHERATRWLAHAQSLAQACEAHGWDGAWYRRAFFDDGSPLGSAANAECRIDSLAQSWAVLSQAADTQRSLRAMESVEQYLVRDGDGLVLLFTPPFDVSMPDPGYIKGYLPGLRENGGQYTHAAIWVLMAQAALGNAAQVGALLDMLNPIRRTDTPGAVQAYRVEPYVVAADIYSAPAHARRGGWTWYTGASGWLYQAILESVLGIRIRGDVLTVTPCMPPAWPGFELTLSLDNTHYRIVVERCENADDVAMTLDGEIVGNSAAPILRDRQQHTLRVSVI